MKTDENKTPPETADAPQGELMKCPECGHDTFTMGKAVVQDEQRYWRTPVRVAGKEGQGLHIEGNQLAFCYDNLHIVCQGCHATFWEGGIMKMWKADGWLNH